MTSVLLPKADVADRDSDIREVPSECKDETYLAAATFGLTSVQRISMCVWVTKVDSAL